MYSLIRDKWSKWNVCCSGRVSLFDCFPNLTSSLSNAKWGSWLVNPNIIYIKFEKHCKYKYLKVNRPGRLSDSLLHSFSFFLLKKQYQKLINLQIKNLKNFERLKNCINLLHCFFNEIIQSIFLNLLTVGKYHVYCDISCTYQISI